MNEFSNKICNQLIDEIFSQIEKLGSVSTSVGYADGSWGIKVSKHSVCLYGYAAENLTRQFENIGLELISKEEYDQASEFKNPTEVLKHFSMSQLSELYEAGHYNLEKNKKKNI